VRQESQIQSAVRRIAANMPSDEPWSRHKFIDLIAEERDRPIVLWPVESALLSRVGLTGTLCGLWVARKQDDFIVYGSDVAEYQADQVIGHEVGHMVLSHTGLPESDHSRAMLRVLLPHVSERTIENVLGRDSFEDDQEAAAESFADHIMVEAMVNRNRRQSPLRSTFFRAK
jgi:hypothetical protein